jgi:hypothetical protein
MRYERGFCATGPLQLFWRGWRVGRSSEWEESELEIPGQMTGMLVTWKDWRLDREDSQGWREREKSHLLLGFSLEDLVEGGVLLWGR